MRIPTLALALALPALAACSRSAPPSDPADARRLHALATGVSQAADAYVVATALGASEACRAARDAYELRIRAALDGIASIADRVDARLRERSGSERADLGCTWASMVAELDRHTDIACTSPDPAANRVEADRHHAVMDRWADVVLARAGEAGSTAPAPRGGPRCVVFGDGERMYMP